jgi:hypothetical protein
MRDVSGCIGYRPPIALLSSETCWASGSAQSGREELERRRALGKRLARAQIGNARPSEIPKTTPEPQPTPVGEPAK